MIKLKNVLISISESGILKNLMVFSYKPYKTLKIHMHEKSILQSYASMDKYNNQRKKSGISKINFIFITFSNILKAFSKIFDI